MGEGVLILPPDLVERIAATVGTPTYVYSADVARSQVATLHRAFDPVPHRIHYSVKANGNLTILGLVRSLGVGVDIVSVGEMRRAIVAGFEADGLVFSGVGKTRAELEEAIAADVGLVNIESEDELELVAEIAALQQRSVRVGIRVNPDVTTQTHPYTQTGAAGMKFGVPEDRVLETAQRVLRAPYLDLVCLGMHIGSQIVSAESYGEGAEKLGALVKELRAGGVDTLTSLDVGGGMAIPLYGKPGLDAFEFAAAVTPTVRETGLMLLLEPGRFVIGNAGVLVTRVLYRKRCGGRTFVVVDAGMNDFARPSYYGAQHDIVVVGNEHGRAEASETVDVVGPICETGDFLGLERTLPPLEAGALLAVQGAGAYGFSMSSNYNSRPRAAEVLLDNGRFSVIRARESIEDLWRGEVVEPEWL